MSSEKWHLVWQICEEARRLPPGERPAYVKEAAANPGVARDALSLLVEPEESVFPSWDQTKQGEGGGTAGAAGRTLTGLRIGRYLVGEAVGSGGSGDVYAARDTELERTVAMKFFKPGTSETRWKVEWLMREAKTASALNHPGIVTVHEVIQSEAGLAIVMEFVDGTALRKLCSAPNPGDRVMRWGAQVADALSAAHRNSIVHRDIKPENLMLRADGLLKVLDFGLAQSSNRPHESVLTQFQIGTLRYMSPEQAAGEPLSPATDIFSLGIVLYELVTGRHPFPADGIIETLQAIRCSSPDPPSRIRRDTPKNLESLIQEMLAKAPEARPQAREVARRLSKLDQPAAGAFARDRLTVIGVITLAALAASLFGGLWFSKHQVAKTAPARLRPVALTVESGFHSWPDISPDGQAVTYGWGESPDAYTALYVKRFDQDSAVKIVEAGPASRIGHPKWSADGQSIYYKRTAPEPTGGALWVVTKDGRKSHEFSHLVSAELSSGIDGSPDGKQIIFADRTTAPGVRFGIQSLNVTSGAKKVLTAPEQGWGDWDPHFSPDGKRIAFKRVNTPGDDQLYVMSAEGGKAIQVTSKRHSISGHCWLPDGNLLASLQWNSMIHGLWRISAVSSEEPDPLFESAFDAVMPAAGKNKVVWIDRGSDYNIYSVSLAGGTPVKRIASPMLDSKPAVARDGRIAYVSHRSGSPEIWLESPRGGNAVRITDLKGDLGRPGWSPDGSRIAFFMRRFGITTVFVARCTQGQLRCEPPVPFVEGQNPTWSVDGKFLYFALGIRDEIRKAPVSGGPSVYVVSGLEALPSRNGKWLYFRALHAGESFLRVPLDANGNVAGGEELVLKRGNNRAASEHWTLAGDEIVFWESDTTSRFSGLRAYNTVTRRLRTVVKTRSAEYPAVSTDGRIVWFAQPDTAGATLMAADFSQ